LKETIQERERESDQRARREKRAACEKRRERKRQRILGKMNEDMSQRRRGIEKSTCMRQREID